MSSSQSILIFDGVCNLCNRLVRFIITRVPDDRIVFSPRQSVNGKSLLKELGQDSLISDTVVYIKGGKHYTESSAVLHILKDIGGYWKIFFVFIIFPAFIRDFIYRVIAKNRYRIFGRIDKCMVPTPDVRNRFLI